MTTTTPTQSRGGLSIRNGIESQLIQILGSPINPDRSTIGKQLWTVYFWQVVADLAKKREEAAWEEIQKGLIGSDDDLRQLSEGEHLVVESGRYSVIAEVSKPQRRFNAEKFAERAARQFRTTVARVTALIEDCKIPSKKAVLSKRVIEVE
jgi:hypothetical protein